MKEIRFLCRFLAVIVGIPAGILLTVSVTATAVMLPVSYLMGWM